MKSRYKTVLILGAGVSKPYGFPLATELLPMIGSLRKNGHFLAYAKTHSLSDDELNDFFDATLVDFHETIDEYLRRNPRHIPVGLSAIAWAILAHERKDSPQSFVAKGTFYRTLFDFIAINPEQGNPSHDVSVITLNYDRSLEYWLDRMITLFVAEADRPEARKRLASVTIHHLHNSLGSIEQLPYATRPSDSVIREASSRLMTIHRRDNAFETSYKVAREMLQGAAMAFILGCSYDQSIFRSLFPEVLESGLTTRTGITRLFGTIVGDNTAMKARIANVFRPGDLNISAPSEMPAEFLPRAAREFHELVVATEAEAKSPPRDGWQLPPGAQDRAAQVRA
jgi:hypothetical protein